MRIGFVTTVLWERYGPFWLHLVRAAGAETVLARPEAVVAHAASLPADEGLLPLLARASLRALDDVDLVIVPRLLPDGVTGPGAGQDPWVADLPAMLARSEPGRAPLQGVPADTGEAVEGMAIPFLTRILGEIGRVRRVWDQHRVVAQRPWRPRPAAGPVAGQRVVAVAGAPWWCTPSLVAALARTDAHVIAQHHVAPAELRAEGRRWRADLVDTDAEALGAVRRFARRAEVTSVRLLIDSAGAADGWLARRATELAGARVEIARLEREVDVATIVRALAVGPPSDPAA